jgi:ribosomal protein S18 acetylase RimI-like enzyme
VNKLPAVSGVTTRPYTDADAAAVADLINRTEVQHGADPGFTEGAVQAIVTTIAKDFERDTRMVFALGDADSADADSADADSADAGSATGADRHGTLIAFGAVSAPPPGGHRADTFGGVHPDWQGRGVGRALLTWQFERIGELRATRAPDEEWQVDAGGNVLDERGIRLFESFGMKPVRYFFDMVADPTAAPDVAVPDGLRVEEYTPELAERLYAAHMEAFSDHWGYQRRPYEEFRTLTVGSSDFRGDLTRIAFDGNEIAGYVLAYDGADNGHYIGQVGTRRPWRRRGLAGALVAQSMRAAAAAGRAKSALGVDADSPTGAVGVYERVGFEVHARFVAYHAPLPATTA